MLCFGFSVYIQKTSVKQFSHVLVPAKTNKKREREKDKNYQLQLSVFYIYCIFSFPPQYEWSYIICSGGRWNEKPFSQDYFSCTPSRLRGAELKLDNTQLQCRYIALLILLNPHPFAHLLILTLTLSLLVECVGCVSPDSRLRTDRPESISSSVKTKARLVYLEHPHTQPGEK